jgi:hypothetical protein
VTRPVLRGPLARAAALALTALIGLPALPAAAARDGQRGPARTAPYQLGDERSAIFPEGITVQDRFFHVSSTTTGAVLRGDLREPGEPRDPGGLHGHVDQATLSETEGCGRPAAPAGRTGPRPVPANPSTRPVIDVVGEPSRTSHPRASCYTCPWNRRCSSRTSPASSGMGPRTGTPGAT